MVLGLFLAGVVTLLASASPGRAEDTAPANALSKVPADSTFFLSLLNNKEQVELLYKSNAYKTLRALPLVKQAHAKLMKDLEKDDSPLAMYKKFTANKENKELVDLLSEAVSDEVVFYGGKNWIDGLRLAMQVNNAQSWAPLTAMLTGGDQQKAQTRAILLALQKNREMLAIPETVFAFKVKNVAGVNNQLKRLEKLAEGAMAAAPPQFQGKLKRQKIGGGDFLTLELDGSVIPWEDVNLKDFEEKKDEFEDLIKAAKKVTLAVSLGVKDGYLLLGITPAAKDLAKFGGEGKSLATVAELEPVVKASGKKLTGISYASAALAAAATATSGDLESIAATLKELLGKAEGLKEERKQAIAKDIDALIADAKKLTRTPGAQMSYAFMTPTGFEGFAYDYTKHENLEGVDVKFRNNLGGNPIFAACFGCKTTGDNYRYLVKWIKSAHGHAEAVLMDSAPDEIKEQYKKVAQALLPIWKKLDAITQNDMLPAIRESGLGLVIDAKWTSKQWHNQAPGTEKAMPMLELGLLVGVSDGASFAKAMTGYRNTLSELYAKVREVSPNREAMPEFAIPAPQSEKAAGANLYFYPIPEEIGLDKQVQPIFGVGKNVAVLAFSKKHAERLLTSKPLTLKSGPLARKGNLVGVAVLDWPQFINVAMPWVEYGIENSGLVPGKEEAAGLLKQARVIAEILKCYKGSSSASYLEDGKLVTHGQATVKDLPKSAEPE
ncbi:MAG: hypothetical protein U0840_14625 [Gemmataceae bacterium]